MGCRKVVMCTMCRSQPEWGMLLTAGSIQVKEHAEVGSVQQDQPHSKDQHTCQATSREVS